MGDLCLVGIQTGVVDGLQHVGVWFEVVDLLVVGVQLDLVDILLVGVLEEVVRVS